MREKAKEKVNAILIFLSTCLTASKELLWLFTNSEYTESETYYPELGRRKNRIVIFLDQLMNIFKYGEINKFYFLYGFDVKNFRNRKEYVDYAKFKRRRDKLNKATPGKPICVLRDKFLFGIVAESLGINTPHNIGLIRNQKIYIIDDKKEMDLTNYLVNNDSDVFVKPSDGECGQGIFTLKTANGSIWMDNNKVTINDVLNKIDISTTYVFQGRIEQHERLKKIFNNSINTIRLVTVINRKNNNVEVLPPLLRAGIAGNIVDNWALGGVAIGIDIGTKSLLEFGYYKPSFGTKTTIHPDSEIGFSGYNIPFLQEAINMSVKFHEHLNQIHSIGWDIAITKDGPCFIEGNDNWEISLVQVCSKGLKEEFNDYF